ncbi:hypothetical protein L7F22_013764 [Adiantum nelumboides]|nr:hypothetical protein [Adiantum nelumboides]
MMHKLRLEVSGPSGFKGNDVSVKYVGVVTVCGIQVGVNMYVLPTKGEGYPIILGGPWLIAMNARQDWESRTLLLKPPRKEGKSIQTIVYNVKEGRNESSELETSEDEWSTEDSSSTVEVTSSVSDNESEKASLLEAMGVVLTRPITQDGGSFKETSSDEKIEDMLSTDLSKEERKEFEVMLQKHSPLFILDYKQIKGVTVVEHQINLKPESQPIAHRLRTNTLIQSSKCCLLIIMQGALQTLKCHPGQAAGHARSSINVMMPSRTNLHAVLDMNEAMNGCGLLTVENFKDLKDVVHTVLARTIVLAVHALMVSSDSLSNCDDNPLDCA